MEGAEAGNRFGWRGDPRTWRKPGASVPSSEHENNDGDSYLVGVPAGGGEIDALEPQTVGPPSRGRGARAHTPHYRLDPAVPGLSSESAPPRARFPRMRKEGLGTEHRPGGAAKHGPRRAVPLLPCPGSGLQATPSVTLVSWAPPAREPGLTDRASATSVPSPAGSVDSPNYPHGTEGSPWRGPLSAHGSRLGLLQPALGLGKGGPKRPMG